MQKEIECFNENKIDRLKTALVGLDYSYEATLFQALSNEGRLQVLHLLNLDTCCVCDLAQAMNAPVPTISQYLRILKKADLVNSEKQGKFIIYTLSPKANKLYEQGYFK